MVAVKNFNNNKGQAYTLPQTKVTNMINNPAKRLHEIAEQIAELKKEEKQIKDFHRQLSKGRTELFNFNWDYKILVQAQKSQPVNLSRPDVDKALSSALISKISKQVFNKCYKSGKKPDQTVKLIAS
jgi:hypothetical protein